MIRTLIFALALAASLPVSAQAPVRPAKAGDVHVYSGQNRTEGKSYEETVTVISVEGDQIRTKHARTDRPDAADGTYGKDWSTFRSGSSGMQMTPPGKTVMHPLAVGKNWESASEATTASGFKLRVKTDSTVAAQERLATPAGEFDTWRIESKGYINPVTGGGWAIVQKVWYAPSIDRIVRIEFREQRPLGLDTLVELKGFRPAP